MCLVVTPLNECTKSQSLLLFNFFRMKCGFSSLSIESPIIVIDFLLLLLLHEGTFIKLSPSIFRFLFAFTLTTFFLTSPNDFSLVMFLLLLLHVVSSVLTDDASSVISLLIGFAIIRSLNKKLIIASLDLSSRFKNSFWSINKSIKSQLSFCVVALATNDIYIVNIRVCT